MPGVTVVAGVLVAVVMDLVESVAIKVHVPGLVKSTLVKVATPPTAVTESVPPKPHVDVRVIESVAPVLPAVSTLPFASSTDTAKLVRAVPATPVAGGSVVKITLLGAPGVTVVAGVLVAVVMDLVESVAIKVHVPTVVKSTLVKVATPPTAVTGLVPPKVQDEVRVIESVAPVLPAVSTLPFASSTETAKLVRAVPAAPVAGGSVVKTTLLGAAGVTVVAGSLVAVMRVRVESVAIKVQLVPLVIVTALKVATPLAAVAESVPPRPHDEVRVITSVEPVWPVVSTFPLPSSTDTVKLASVAPAVVDAGGSVVKTTANAAPGVTVVAGVLVAVVMDLVESVAVKVHVPTVVKSTLVKVATPPTAVTGLVPPKPHVDVRVIESVAPVLPAVSTFPFASSTETAKLVSVAPAVVDAGGSVVKTTLLGAPGVTVVAGVLVAVVMDRVESVAVKVHVPTVVKSTLVKVATPPTAVTESVPPKVQDEVRVIESVAPVLPAVSTLPFASSTETAKLVRAVPAAPVAGGSVVKTTLLGAAGVTVVAGLLVAVVMDLVESVAVKVQLVPLLMVTALKVATPLAAVAVSVPPKVHDEVRVIESAAPVLPFVSTLPFASSIDTVKLASVAPAVVDAGGSVVKTTLLGAPGVTVVAGVLVAVVMDRVESVAVRVHEPDW